MRDGVAVMIIDADERDVRTSSLDADGRTLNFTEGCFACSSETTADTRALRLLLTIVHDSTDAKACKWRSRCAKICAPAPNATMCVGDTGPTRDVDSKEPNQWFTV